MLGLPLDGIVGLALASGGFAVSVQAVTGLPIKVTWASRNRTVHRPRCTGYRPARRGRGHARFDGIGQQWLRGPVKRCSRFRLATGCAFTTIGGGALALTRFSRFLATCHPEVAEPGAITRPVLEDYQSWLLTEILGRDPSAVAVDDPGALRDLPPLRPAPDERAAEGARDRLLPWRLGRPRSHHIGPMISEAAKGAASAGVEEIFVVTGGQPAADIVGTDFDELLAGYQPDPPPFEQRDPGDTALIPP